MSAQTNIIDSNVIGHHWPSCAGHDAGPGLSRGGVQTWVRRLRDFGRSVMPERVASAAAMAFRGSADAMTICAAGSKNSNTSGDTSSRRPTTCE